MIYLTYRWDANKYETLNGPGINGNERVFHTPNSFTEYSLVSYPGNSFCKESYPSVKMQSVYSVDRASGQEHPLQLPSYTDNQIIVLQKGVGAQGSKY